MDRKIIIKKHELTHEHPTICVPVMKETEPEITDEVKRLSEKGIEMVEWRIDYYAKINDRDAVRSVLHALSALCKNIILLVTYRSSEQGGKGTLSEKETEALLTFVAQTRYADLIDVEYFSYQHPERLIRTIQKEKVRVICSHHDFKETPERKVMRMLLEQMADVADIVKIAVMPNSEADVLRLLSVTNAYHQEHDHAPIISMSMGRLGMISRISGEVFGSCVTFGTMGAASAPGQLPVEQLRQALAFMHENYTE